MLRHQVINLLLLVEYWVNTGGSSTGLEPEPEFAGSIPNVTVTSGRTVRLSCPIRNLGSYQVAWIRYDKSAILAVQNQVITRNPRIKVTDDNLRTFFLYIQNVTEEDAGLYMCQINTVKAKTSLAWVNVVVPPDIPYSTPDTTVPEGSNASLICLASGSPPPKIYWQREDRAAIVVNRTVNATKYTGEILSFPKVSVDNTGAYLCIASNGIPPSVSKRVHLDASFLPRLTMPHQMLGSPLHHSVVLECRGEAFPIPLYYWEKDTTKMMETSKKYSTEIIQGGHKYRHILKLTIKNVDKSDFGVYKCIAESPMGRAEGVVKLYLSQTTGPNGKELPENAHRKGQQGLTSQKDGIVLASNKQDTLHFETPRPMLLQTLFTLVMLWLFL